MSLGRRRLGVEVENGRIRRDPRVARAETEAAEASPILGTGSKEANSLISRSPSTFAKSNTMNDKPKRVRKSKSLMAQARAQANLGAIVAEAVKLAETRAAKAAPGQRLGRPKVHTDRAAYRREWMRRHRAAAKAQTAPAPVENTAQ
jgi:hypothetical protein